jgi:tetratricopeptide (TPR) repeat protein
MATDESYLNLFHAYIQKGLQQALERVRAAEPLVPEADRQQAWHLLSYAFNVDAAWPATRDLMLALAPKMEQAGQREEWIAYLEQGLRQSQAVGDSLTTAECQVHIGHLYRLVSKFNPARQWLTASVEGFAAQGDKQGQARALNQLAYVEYLQHQYDEANGMVEQALALLEAEDPERAMSYFIQGMIAIDHERWQEAEAYHCQSLMLREKQGDKRRIAWSLQNLGYALRGQGKFSEAIIYYQQAIENLKQIGDAYNSAIAQMNLGIAYNECGQPAVALLYYRGAEAIFHKVYDRLYLAKLYNNLGVNYLALSDWSQAENAFLFSIDQYERIVDDNARLDAIDGLAMTYLAQQQYVKAKNLLESALATLSRVTDRSSHDYLLASLTKHLQEARQGIIDLALTA